MAAQVLDINVWTTSGLSAGWQVLSGSDASFIQVPSAFESTTPMPFVAVEVPFLVEVARPTLPDFTVEAPADDTQLRLALLELLQFRLEPDEPTDADVRAPADLQFGR